VEVEHHMDAVLLAELHGAIDLTQLGFFEAVGVVALCPDAVVQRQAHEVEAQLGNPLEVLLLKGRVAPLQSELIQQVEPAPAWELARGRLGQCALSHSGKECTLQYQPRIQSS
jgi:hypothetical protein